MATPERPMSPTTKTAADAIIVDLQREVAGLALALNRILRILSEDAGGKPSNRDGTGDWAKAGREARELALGVMAAFHLEVRT